MKSPWSDSPAGPILKVRVVPRASKTEVAGMIEDALKIRLQAPPVDGKANQALIHFVAERLGIHARQVQLLSGETGRTKRLLIRGLSLAQAQPFVPH